MFRTAFAFLIWSVSTLSASQSCHTTTIVQPQPFLGTAEEIIVFSDGTVWKDLSYKYLYLYVYSPTVQLCPDQGKMTLGEHVFFLMRIR